MEHLELNGPVRALTSIDRTSAQVSDRSHWCRAGLFILLGLLIAVLLQHFLLRGLGRYSAGNIGIVNDIMRGRIIAEVLISGSSRAMYHYDPYIIEETTHLKCYNIGRNGTKLHEQASLLNLYLLKNKSPVYLIQNLDITSLQANDDVTDPKQYIAWLGSDDVYRPLVQQKQYYILYRWCPLLAIAWTGGMREAILGLLEPGTVAAASQPRGYSPQKLSWNDDFDRFKSRYSSGFSWQIDHQKIETLAGLLEICQKNSIRVILVYSPEYRATQEFFQGRGETVQVFRDMALRFQVPLWDYSTDPICENKEYFYNSQHMNHKGATAFSRVIGRRLAVEER